MTPEEAAEELLLHDLEQRERAARLRGSEPTAEPPSPRDSDVGGGPATVDQPELEPLILCNKLFDTLQQATCFCLGRLGPRSVPFGLSDTLEVGAVGGLTRRTEDETLQIGLAAQAR